MQTSKVSDSPTARNRNFVTNRKHFHGLRATKLLKNPYNMLAGASSYHYHCLLNRFKISQMMQHKTSRKDSAAVATC